MDLFKPGKPICAQAQPGHILPAGFGILLIGLAGIGMLTDGLGGSPSLAHVGWVSPLLILFYLILTPIGLIARIFGKDFLDLKLNKEQASYWNIRETVKYEKLDTERQF